MTEKKTHPCRSCGKELKEEYLICPYCGTLKELLCAKCGKHLEEEYQNCPYCGEPVKKAGKKRQPSGESTDFSGQTAAALTGAGAFLNKIGRAIGAGAMFVFNWLKKISQKGIGWIKGLDWSGLKGTFGKFISSAGSFFQKAFTWLKEISGKAWVLLKGIYSKLRDLISATVLKKMDPEKSRRTAAIILAGGALALVCILVFSISGGTSEKEPASGQAQTEEGATPIQIAGPAPVDRRWLVMVYADADDSVLEEDIYFELNEIEAAGSTDLVQVVAQIDRNMEGYQGDGDWTTARRYAISQGADLTTISSEVVEDLGEVNMSSTETLVDFASWAIETYPADRYALIFLGQGAGWIGGWYDNDPEANQVMWLNDLSAALGTITQETGIEKLELVGMDANLMGMIEVHNALAPYARYAVASEEIEPGVGWAYSDFLGKLNEHPEMSGAELARAIVEGYLSQDLRIQDDQARKELLAQFNMKADIPADVLADELGNWMTLSAVDLSALPELNSKFNNLLQVLKESDQDVVAEAHRYAQAFEDYYIDLGSFLSMLADVNEDAAIDGSIAEVQTAYQQAVIAERHGPQRPGSTGMSIHFPYSDFYWDESAYDCTKYPIRADRFAESSLWDDYLAYHYAGKEFGTGIPDAAERIQAPGVSKGRMGYPVITPGTVSTDDARIRVQVAVEPENLAYIYVNTLLKQKDKYRMYTIDLISLVENREVGGVVFPVWDRENESITLDFEMFIWPTVISDGKTTIFMAFEDSITYARTKEERVYAVKGYYINQDSGEETKARMFFNNKGEREMEYIVGYYGSASEGKQTRLIKPRKGDRFLFGDRWWKVDESLVNESFLMWNEENTLTFGDEPFTQGMSPSMVEKGTYVVGVSVLDLDGHEWNATTATVVVE